MICRGCGAPAAEIDFVVSGNAAERQGVAAGTVMMTFPVCAACLAKSERQLERLRVEFRRLKKRLRTRSNAGDMMCRRVDRYYRNGTFRRMEAA